MTLKNFIEECRKKDVLKLISIYVVSTWVMLQVLSVTWQPLGLPGKSVTILIIILLAGFPVYLFYIWKFRLHISEDKMEQFDKKKAAKKTAFKTVYFTVLLSLSLVNALAITVIVKVNFFDTSSSPVAIADANDKIAVLQFGNNTGDAAFDVVGKMTADWIIHGINEKEVAQVISSETLSAYMDLNTGKNRTSEKAALTKYLNPSKIISGNIFLDKGKLVLQGSIQASGFSETLISFQPQECESDNPLDCIENLKQLVVSYLFLEDKEAELNLQEYPPKFDAYQNVIEAKANYYDFDRYIELLDKAITQDSAYFEPKVLRVAYYYGEGAYTKADSLYRLIEPSSYSNKRQLNLLRHYEALLSGENDKIYTTVKNEYVIAPFDLQTNSSTMVVALQFVNRPQDVAGFYNDIDMAAIEIENCPFCNTRLYVKVLAAIQLGNYEEALVLSDPLYERNTLFVTPWLVAHIRAGNMDSVTAYCDQLELTDTEDIDVLLDVAYEYSLLGNKEKVTELTDKIISSTIIKNRILLEFLYLSERYEDIVSSIDLREVTNSKDYEAYSKIAVTYEKLGNNKASQRWIDKLEEERGVYQFGAIDYALAQYYAATDDSETMFDYLDRAVQAGALFKTRTFENDPLFIKYKDDPAFVKIMEYWYEK